MLLYRHFYIYIYIYRSCWPFYHKSERCPHLKTCLKVTPRAKILIGYWLCFSLKLIRGVNKLNHFLVLLCGVGFIFISGLAFLVLRVVEKYPLSNKTQRILHLAVFIFLAIFCILIFDWYSSEYIKNSAKSWVLNRCQKIKTRNMMVGVNLK